MSSLHLIELAATENHVKFRSLLGEMLYSKLSEEIKEKTKDLVAEIFETERVDDMSPLVEYIGNVINTVEETLQTELTEEEITESTNHIISLLEKAKKDDEKEEEKKKEDEEEKKDKEQEEEDNDEEDEDEEDEDEDEEEEEEDEEEEMIKRGGKSIHFDFNSHNKGKK